MPEADLAAMLKLAESIRASERMQDVQDGLAASGWTKASAVSRHLRALERQSRIDQPTPGEKRKAPSEQIIAASLRQAGIQVVRAGGES